jgi:hypothetical protein
MAIARARTAVIRRRAPARELVPRTLIDRRQDGTS